MRGYLSVAPSLSEVTYRAATHDDLPQVAQVYLSTFQATLNELRSRHLAPLAVADVISACLIAEPGCIVVAQNSAPKQIVGYVIAMADAAGAWRAALVRCLPIIWLRRWLTGRYRLPLRGGLILIADTCRFLRAAHLRGANCRARILSIAVTPALQGRGIGKQLLQIALSRLSARGTQVVRLEVRPQNQGAHRLYEKFGFTTVGQYVDSRGPWHVMTLRLARPRR